MPSHRYSIHGHAFGDCTPQKILELINPSFQLAEKRGVKPNQPTKDKKPQNRECRRGAIRIDKTDHSFVMEIMGGDKACLINFLRQIAGAHNKLTVYCYKEGSITVVTTATTSVDK